MGGEQPTQFGYQDAGRGRLHSSDIRVGRVAIRLAFDGDHVWVTYFYSNTVTKMRAMDGAVLGTVAVGNAPPGSCSAGHLWIAHDGERVLRPLGVNSVTAIEAGHWM